MLRLVRWFAGAAAMLLLAGCAAPSTPSDAATPVPVQPTAVPTAAPTPTTAPTPTPQPLPAGVHWAVEPSFAYDDVQPMMYHGRKDRYDFNSNRGIVTADGNSSFTVTDAEGETLKGLTDVNGTVIAEPRFTDLYCDWDAQYAIVRDWDEFYTLDENGQLAPSTMQACHWIIGTCGYSPLVWVEDEGTFHCAGGCDTGIDPWTTSGSHAPCAAYWLDTYEENLPLECKVVLTDGTRPVSNDQYEKAGAYSCGVIPVCQNGRWGYADEQGSLVFPCEYDASFMKSAYPATEDTVVLCRDGQYALYNLDGTERIPFGVLDALRPVQGGRLWACQNGLWGVLELETA